MRMQLILILISIIFFSNSVFGSNTNSIFTYEHTKGEKCAEKWTTLEEIIKANKVRCKGLKILKGFPYLRGNSRLLSLSKKISTKYSKHKWLELLRRTDLQARYVEIDALPKTELEKFCKEAGIDCFTGRIRAYVARCSAIIMGDEKRNHDYMEKVLESALNTINAPDMGTLICFENPETLDGLFNEDTFMEIFIVPRTKLAPGYLNKRIQGIKNLPKSLRR